MTVPVILLQIVKLYGEFCDSSYEKSWVSVQNQWVPFKKQIQNWKCLGLYVTRQLIWRQTQNLCITIYWNFYVNWSTKKANRNIHRYTTAIITATEITRTSGIYVQIDLCVPWDVCHELFYVFGDFSVSRMQAIEVTKSLQYKTYTKKQVFYSRVTLQLLLRQTMWLQPPFFSMVTWHFGHSCNNRKTIRKMSLKL